MARRHLVLTPLAAALLLVEGAAWAGPPPPPPSSAAGGGEGGERIEAAPQDPLSIDQRTPDTDLTPNWDYSRGADRGPNYVRQSADDPFYAVNPIGYYQGVSVGGGTPPYAPQEIGGESAVLTWTGFERGEASSRVFFQLSAAVEPEITPEAGRVLVKLPRTSVTVRNNRRSLITKFFKTPVTEVEVKRAGKDLVVVLELRWAATPSWRFESGANGYQVLVLEFSDTQGDRADGAPPPPPAPPVAPAQEDEPEPASGPFLPTD